MPSSRFVLAGFTAVLLGAHLTVLGQSAAPRAEAVRPPGAPAPSYYPPAERMEVVDPDKKLAAGDEVTIEIEQDREGGFPKVVTATGDIDVPPCGRIKVAGKTTAEAAAEIRRQLEKDYYYTATVRLSIDRVSRNLVTAGQITISGEVRSVGPLNLIAGEKLTVSQAILKAGGFGTFAKQDKVQVTRTDNGATRQFYINVKEVLGKGNLDKDAEVRDGDRIHVSKAAIIW